MRAFAIASVVAIHTLMPYREILPPQAPVRVFDDLLHYAVPLFVFISGALVWARPWRGGPGAYREFLSRRFSAIALPYLAWAALYSAIFVLQAEKTGPTLARLPGLVLTGHVWYHLYFIPMLLTFYLLTPVAARLVRWQPELAVVAAYAVRLLAGPAIVGAARAVFGELGWQYATHVVIHLPHMMLGAWFATRLDEFPEWFPKLWPLLLTYGLAVNTAASLGLFATWPRLLRNLTFADGMAGVVLGLTFLAFALEPRFDRWAADITRAGSLAFGVYFVHPLFLLGLVSLLAASSAEQLWLRPWFPAAVWGTVTAASFAAAGLLAQRPATAWLVGLRATRRY